MPRLVAVAALLTAVALFAGGFVAARFHFEAGGTPADVTLLRYAPAGLLLAPLALGAARRVGVGRACVLALGQGLPFGGFVFIGMQGAPISHGSTIVPGLGLVLGVLGAAAFLGDRLTAGRLAGLALGIAGIAALTGPSLLGGGEGVWWAELAYMASGTLVAVYTLLVKRWAVRPLDGAALAMTFSLPLCVVVAMAFEMRPAAVGELATVAQALYQGVAFAIGGVVLFSYAIARLGPVASVAATPLLPMIASGLDHIIFDAPLSPAAGLALALMIGCVVLLSREVPPRPG